MTATQTNTLRSVSPQKPDRVLVEEGAAEPAAVATAVQAAKAAGRAWWDATGTARAQALSAAAEAVATRHDAFADLIVAEVGKPRTEAVGEIARAVALLRYFAQDALRGIGEVIPPSSAGMLLTERRPHGVAGLITPWNFPVAIPLWKAAPALAAGNAVVLKPSTSALACARLLEQTLTDSLPAGLFTVVAGERDTATALLDAVDVASFTGSTAVGHSVIVRAATNSIPVQAEMGGQNAAIVLPDADVQSTADMLVAAAMGYAGQKCTATRRVIVVGDATELTDAMAARIESMAFGDPDASATVAGPVISDSAQRAVVTALKRTVVDGGRVVATRDTPDGGYYAPPALISGLAARHPLNQQETFGPLVSVLAVDSDSEAVAVANDTEQGLVTSVHGRDLERVMSAVRKLDTGMIKVNAPSTGVDFNAPFGGEKASSYGLREQGPGAREFYSSTRTITLGFAT